MLQAGLCQFLALTVLPFRNKALVVLRISRISISVNLLFSPLSLALDNRRRMEEENGRED